MIRTLAATGRWRTLLGVSPGFRQRGQPALKLWHGPRLDGERISPANLWRALRVAWQVRRWLRRGRWRIFHGHSRAGLLVAGWLWLLGERRVLATVHVFGRQRWFYWLARRALGARVRWLGPAMAEYYGVTPPDAAEYLADCVPDLGPARVPRSPAVRVVFGCAGGIVRIKNWELVIRALGLAAEKVPVVVKHAGAADGSPDSEGYAAELRELARGPGVAGRWEWLGHTDDMGTFHEAIDVFVVASPLEASSVAALEALAAGVPVLAPAGSGTRDLVAAGGGWVYADKNPSALAEQMIALGQGTTLSGWRRKDAGLQRYLADTVARAHVAAYDELLAS